MGEGCRRDPEQIAGTALTHNCHARLIVRPGIHFSRYDAAMIAFGQFWNFLIDKRDARRSFSLFWAGYRTRLESRPVPHHRRGMSRRDPAPKPKRMKVTIPEGTGPHVKLIFAEMRRQALNCDEVAWRSGVLKATLKAWRHRNRPSLENIEAVLSVLGFDLVPVPRDAVLSPDLIAALQPIADEFGLSMPDARTALLQIVTGMPSSGTKRPAFPESNLHLADRIAA